MRFMLFSVRDLKSGVMLQPFVARSESDAKRQLSQAFESPEFLSTPAGRYPDEFSLCVLGSFDDESGEIVGCLSTTICFVSDLRPLPPTSTVSS